MRSRSRSVSAYVLTAASEPKSDFLQHAFSPGLLCRLDGDGGGGSVRAALIWSWNKGTKGRR